MAPLPDWCKLQNIDFAGKTGTAQTESFDLQNKLGKKLKENGWFVGYAPRRNPEIVVAALVQGGGWGSTRLRRLCATL